MNPPAPFHPAVLIGLLSIFAACGTNMATTGMEPDSTVPTLETRRYSGTLRVNYEFTGATSPESSDEVAEVMFEENGISVETRKCPVRGNSPTLDWTQGEEVRVYELEELRSTCALFVRGELVDFVVLGGSILWAEDHLHFEIAGQGTISGAEFPVVVRFDSD